MATQAQYTAAEAAVQKHANDMIAKLSGFEQGMVRQHITADLMNGFAKVAVDAALAVHPPTVASSANQPSGAKS
jgi:hypothetical protein